MLNYIWGVMIILGIIYGAFSGNMVEITNGALDSAKEAVTLCITMIGFIGLWSGLMEVARGAGLIQRLTYAIQPLLTFLFPKIPKNHKAREYISLNIISNILGLGWAATPAGLKAMESLAELEKERQGTNTKIASQEMCTFLIVNISSLQLIPVNIIAYRSQYGSVNPTAVIAPGILATLISTLAAIVFCKIMQKKRNEKF